MFVTHPIRRFAITTAALALAILARQPCAAAAATHIDVNRIDMIVSNGGSFGYDAASALAGLEYPRGTGKFALFAGGLWIGARVGGATRVAVATLDDEFGPGSLVNGVPDDPGKPNYKVYKLSRSYGTASERDSLLADYTSGAIPLGAPPVVAAGGQLDITGHQMLWHVYNDGDPSRHTAGSTAPLGVEVRQTTFAYDEAGPMGNTILFRYQILNRGLVTLDSAFVGIWADPDIGSAADDLVGSDRGRALGYGYNGTSDDGIYDGDPPAVGVMLLRGPVVAGDTLPATACVRIIRTGDPVNGEEMYQSLLGRHPDGSPFIDPGSLQISTFTHDGDPVLGTDWLDLQPADRRMLVAAGPFTMAPGGSQTIFAALVIGDGADHLDAITALRAGSDEVRSYFRRSFDRTTAVEVALTHAEAESDRVRLTWLAAERPGLGATVERAELPDSWSPVAEITADAGGTLTFEDRDVIAARRYGYRLRFDEGAGSVVAGETWIDVPAGLALALDGARPNPTERDLTIGFALPDAGPARVELFDLAGRRLMGRDVGALGAGRHLVRLADARRLPVGLYVVRLSAAGRSLTARVTVMR